MMGGHEAPWAVRVIPLALLIGLALAGLRGAITTPRWDGPLRREGMAIGIAFAAVLITLLVITDIRRRAARTPVDVDSAPDVAAKLRLALIWLLSGGIVAAIVTMLIATHLHLFTVKPHQLKSLPQPTPQRKTPRPVVRSTSGFGISLHEILYGLLVLMLILLVVVAIAWSSRLAPPVRLGEDGDEDTDAENLREAVQSGRSALRTLDDARAAIIACYLAMEQSLAERGAARGVADTPDELLDRATRGKIVHGTAAARLTALFYEARFSSHPMDQAQRQAAEQALDELATALAAGV